MRFIKYIFIVFIASSCAIEQDYYFDDNGEVKMDIGVDMSALYKSLPNDGSNDALSGIKDSLDANNDLQDSMEYYGITKMDVDFDTTKYKLTSEMTFKDLEHFEKFMNKDRDEGLKPIVVKFSKKGFEVKNCASLLSDELLSGLKESQEAQKSDGLDGSPDMDMSNFFSFKTTYHFPYLIEKFESESGNGLLSEDKKSITFENNLDDFTNDGYKGDLEVIFK